MHVSWSLSFVFPSDPKFEQKKIKIRSWIRLKKKTILKRLELFKGQRMSVVSNILNDNTFLKL